MATNVFISFDHDDQRQIGGFRSLKSNPDHDLEFHDHSLKEPVTNASGKLLRYPPSDARSKPVRDEIKERFGRCLKLVVLIGENTHKSDWVTWEIETFYDMKEPLSGDKTWKRIRGMRLKGMDDAIVPSALGDRATKTMNWDPESLDRWIDKDPDA